MKKLVRLTEQDLHRIVKESVKRVIKESYLDSINDGHTYESVKQVINEMLKNNIIAYHGTPHNFLKFQTKNIGTGEGNQSFGYGLYFTSNKSVAEFYAKLLGNGNGNVYKVSIKGGEFFEWNKPLDKGFKEQFIKAMKEENMDKMPFKRFLNNGKIETRYEAIENAVNYFPNGKFFYENLSLMVGGDRNASQFLSKLGFIGISYPVGQFFKKGSNVYGENYVIFNENDVEIISSETI